MRAVVTGSATPMGWPCRGGPGQLPAVSPVCAVTPPRTAAWISGMVPRRCGCGSASWSDQRPLTRVNGTVPSAERSEERMTGVSAPAVAAPIWPLIRIGVPGSLASRRWAAAGSASAPKPASAVVTATEVRMANRRLAGRSGADPRRRSTNDARAPRTARRALPGRRWRALAQAPAHAADATYRPPDGPAPDGNGYPFGAQSLRTLAVTRSRGPWRRSGGDVDQAGATRLGSRPGSSARGTPGSPGGPAGDR